MTSNAGRGFFSHRIPTRILTSAIFAACLSGTALSPAYAQEDEAPAWSLKRLFTSRKIEPATPEPEPQAAAPAAARKKARVSREPVETPSAIVAKRPDAKGVLVIGDFLGSGLAEGLSTAFVENPHVKVIDRTNGSSGFVRDDFYDWPARVGALIDAENPAAIVIMLGANDRQQMLVDGTREQVRSETWLKEYTERTQSLAKAIADRKVPFIWVGVPSFKSSKMLLDMLAFNEIFKSAATAAGGEFVDIWDGFVDEDGAYVANGPDLNGQPARLRAADGINLARPGKRKLAFYTEKPLGKLLGDAVNAPEAVDDVLAGAQPEGLFIGPVLAPPAEEAERVIGPSDMGPIEPGLAISLRSPALDGGTELLGLVAEPRHDARTPAEKLVIEGIASAAKPGRADDFSWSPFGETMFASSIAPAQPTTGKGIVPVTLASLVVSAPPTAPAAVLGTIDFTETPAIAVPTTAMPDRQEIVAPETRMPVTALAPAGPPEEDRTVAFKGRVFVAPPGSTGDKSPSRASPTASPVVPASSGPAAEGAPTELPPAIIELPPAEVEIPVAAQAAPTILALTSTADAPAGDRAPAPRILRTARGDAAPSPSITPQAVPAATTSGPAASAAPMAPDMPAQDLAPERAEIGRIASAGAAPSSRSAPTDHTALTAGDISPNRAAPAMASAPQPDRLHGKSLKAPPALDSRTDDGAPAAPAVAIASPPAIDGNFSSVPAILTPDVVASAPGPVPAPSTLPDSEAQLASLQESPALAVPPATNFGQPVEEPVAAPAANTEPAVPVVEPAPSSPTIEAEPTGKLNPVLAVVAPPQPAEAAPLAPTVAPDTGTVAPAETFNPATRAKTAAAAGVPASDFASLKPVPPDLSVAVSTAKETVAVSVEAQARPDVPDSQPETTGEAIAALGTKEADGASSVAPATDDDAVVAQPRPVVNEPGKTEQPVGAADVETPTRDAPTAAKPEPVERSQPVVEASPVLPAEPPVATAKPAHAVPEIDVALLEAVPPDLTPATVEPTVAQEAMAPAGKEAQEKIISAPGPEADAPDLAALAPEAPKEKTPALSIKAADDDALPAALPTAPAPNQVSDVATAAKSEPAVPVSVPGIDVALLEAVPPDLIPSVPARNAPAPKAAVGNDGVPPGSLTPADKPKASVEEPAAASTDQAEQAVAAVQPKEPVSPVAEPANEGPAGLPIADPQKLISVPETDISMLQAVPPDLLPASAPAAVQPPADKTSEKVIPVQSGQKPAFVPFDSVDDIPPPLIAVPQ